MMQNNLKTVQVSLAGFFQNGLPASGSFTMELGEPVFYVWEEGRVLVVPIAEQSQFCGEQDAVVSVVPNEILGGNTYYKFCVTDNYNMILARGRCFVPDENCRLADISRW